MAGAGARARRAAGRGRRATNRAAHSGLEARLGRAGLLGRGVFLVAIGVVVIEVALGSSGQEADRRGAIEQLAQNPFGAALVALCAAGFAGHAVWRWLEAAGGLHGDRGRTGALKRLGFVAAGLFYAVLAVSSVAVLAGRSNRSEEQSSKETAAHLVGIPLGSFLLALVGIGLCAGGVGLGVWTLRRGFEKRLREGAMAPRLRVAVRALEFPGEAARVALLLVAGGLVLRSAVHSDPRQTPGLDGTLRTLAGQPFGSALLVAIAGGLIALGVVSFLEAPYLRTTHDERRRRR